MGVSISRPPRCERGALPAELIAPEGSHKLSVPCASSRHLCAPPSVVRVRRRRRSPCPVDPGAPRCRPGRSRRTGRGRHHQIDGWIAGADTSRAKPLASIATHDPTPEMPSGPGFAGFGELGEHDDADDSDAPRRRHRATGLVPGRGGSGRRHRRRRPVRAVVAVTRRRRAGPRWGASEGRVVHRSTSRVAEHPIGLVDRRHRPSRPDDPSTPAGRDGARGRGDDRRRGSPRRALGATPRMS